VWHRLRIEAYLTVKLTDTTPVRFFKESVPFTVSLNVPRAEECVFTDSFVVPDVVMDIGENDALLPDGNPDTLNTTVPV